MKNLLNKTGGNDPARPDRIPVFPTMDSHGFSTEIPGFTAGTLDGVSSAMGSRVSFSIQKQRILDFSAGNPELGIIHQAMQHANNVCLRDFNSAAVSGGVADGLTQRVTFESEPDNEWANKNIHTWAKRDEASRQLTGAIMDTAKYPFESEFPESKALYEYTMGSLVGNTVENLVRMAKNGISVDGGFVGDSNMTNASTTSDTGEGPMQAMRVMRTLLPFSIVPTYYKLVAEEAFTPYPFPKNQSQLIVPVKQVYMINAKSGTRIKLPQGYRTLKGDTYSANPLLEQIMPLYQRMIPMADFTPDYVDFALPTGGTQPVVDGLTKGFNLLTTLGTTSEVLDPVQHSVDALTVLTHVRVSMLRADGLTTVTQDVPIYYNLNSAIKTEDYELDIYASADIAAGAAAYDAAYAAAIATTPTDIAAAQAAGQAAAAPFYVSRKISISVKFNLKDSKLTISNNSIATATVVGVAIHGNVSTRTNTYTNALAHDLEFLTVIKGDGMTFNAALPLHGGSDWQEVYDESTSYASFLTENITRILSDTITMMGLRHLERKIEVDKQHYQDLLLLNDTIIVENNAYDPRPSKSNPYNGLPTDWIGGMLIREIEVMAIRQIAYELLPNGRYVLFANTAEASLFNYAREIKVAGNASVMQLGWQVSLVSIAGIKAQIISNPNMKPEQLIAMYRNDHPDYIRDMFMPCEFMIHPVNSGFRNPMIPNVPNIFANANAVHVTLRQGGIFTIGMSNALAGSTAIYRD